MFLILLFSLFSSSLSYSSQEVSSFQWAKNLIAQGKEHEAYSLLDQIPVQDSEFLSALLELQKIHYTQNEWDKFFAYSIFYRQRYLTQPPFRLVSTLLSLEVLALSKQCLWEEALSLVEFGIDKSQSLKDKKSLEELEQAAAVLKLHHSFPKLRNEKKGSDVPHGVLRSDLYWPIRANLIDTVQHPRFLRLKIENRCSN